MKLAIQGIGAVTPFGDHNAEMSAVFTKAPNFSQLSGQQDGVNKRVGDLSQLYDYLPKKKIRRVDHLSRMALLAAGKALKDTDPELISNETTGVIIATGFGALQTTFDFLDSYIEKGDKLASPTHFSNSVHNAPAAHISTCYGITGPNLTVSQFDMSFISALITAGTWLETGKTDAVLLGTSDAFCDVLGYCIKRFTSRKENKEYSFGEGASFFMLTREMENTKYGYFEKMHIGNYGCDDLNIPKDALLFLSPSSISACNDRFISFLKNNNKSYFRKYFFSPTDSGLDSIIAAKLKKKTYHIKVGRNSEYGSMSITPDFK